MFLQKIAFPKFFAKSQPTLQTIDYRSSSSAEVVRVVGNEIKITGPLDRKSYLQVIEAGRKVYKQGYKQLVINLERVKNISTPGLFALYSLLLIFQGQEPPMHIGGHAALSQMSHDLKHKNIGSPLQFENGSAQLVSILDQVGF